MSDLTCRGCSGNDIHLVVELGFSALADSYPSTALEARSQPTWPLRMVVCRDCWLAQLADLVPDEMLFGTDYGFFSGTSPALVRHFRAYAEWAAQTFPQQLARGVVEIACNDGTLLTHFDLPGRPVVGFDPAGPPTEAARVRGLDVRTEAFGLEVAKRCNLRDGLVIANNVLAHVADPHDLLAGVRVLLGKDGLAVFEFQYVADLIAGNLFDLVYHEHRSYLSLSALSRLLGEHGLVAVDTAHVPVQGGSLRVVVGPDDGRTVHPRVAQTWEAEGWLRHLDAYGGIQGRVEHIRDRLRWVLAEEHAAGRSIAGYAATAKSTTLLAYCGIGAETLEYVVDTTPAKVGRFTPGTGIPIISPEREQERGRTDTLILLAPNYLSGVLRREREFLDSGGRLIVPLPVPVVI